MADINSSKYCFVGCDTGIIDIKVSVGADDGVRWTIDGSFSAIDTWDNIGYDPSFGSSHGFFRWDGITLKGTIITSYIKLYSGSNPDSGTSFKIYGVDEDNPDAPTSATEFDADPLTNSSVIWSPSIGTGYKQSPSLNPIFQELVNTYTIENEAVMLQVKDNYGGPLSKLWIIRMWDYVPTGSYAAILHIEYTIKRTSSKSCFIKGGVVASSSKSCFINGVAVSSSKPSYIKGKALVSSYKSCFTKTLIYSSKPCFLKTEGRKYGPAAAHM